MIKKLISMLCSLAFALCCTSCSESDVNVISQIQDASSNNISNGTILREDSADSNSVLYFTSPKGHNIFLGAMLGEISNQLGAYNSYYETKNSNSDGLDKIYTYDGFKLYTSSEDNYELVSVIEITHEKCQTHEGVSIGDDIKKVTEIYGNPSQNNAYVLAKGNTQLIIVFADGAVTSIQYKLKRE